MVLFVASNMEGTCANIDRRLETTCHVLENINAGHELKALDGVRGIFARLGPRNETHGCLSEKPNTGRTEPSGP